MSAGIGAVVVNRDAGSALVACVDSLRRAGVEEVVVVDNASSDGSLEALARRDRAATIVAAGRNLGYGRAANLGVARLGAGLVLVCNPDLVVDPGAPGALAGAIEADPAVGVAGPLVLRPDGVPYPSARAFPSLVEAAGHALLGPLWPSNPWSRRYRLDLARERGALDAGPVPVDWVSGACALFRREAFDAVGGFDEGYFMYVEDLDLCWRLRRAGWEARYVPAARVVHHGGLSSARHPYRMLVAHHRSTWRFARRSSSGLQRLVLPAVAAGLAARLGVSLAGELGARARRALAAGRPA
ncbi:MAG TPA: glycosyltransferase family 2 protein [Acidimicrobiales bacterium]|nr:glycosyltransferase family 2 protein [Acidimicrobiales bacterium]